MQNILESMMLLCFGFSWPISVVNNYRSRTTRGMSLPFILLIIFGYICGITAKLISHNITYVLAVYIFNLLAVSTNLPFTSATRSWTTRATRPPINPSPPNAPTSKSPDRTPLSPPQRPRLLV
ncbi:MAG: hypothetical protein V8T01_04115 [Oscillospiraceae bacterium]